MGGKVPKVNIEKKKKKTPAPKKIFGTGIFIFL